MDSPKSHAFLALNGQEYLIHLTACPTCNGRLFYQRTYHYDDKAGIEQRACPTCNGKGMVLTSTHMQRIGTERLNEPQLNVMNRKNHDMIFYSRFWKWVTELGCVFDRIGLIDNDLAVPRHEYTPDHVRDSETALYGEDPRSNIKTDDMIVEEAYLAYTNQ